MRRPLVLAAVTLGTLTACSIGGPSAPGTTAPATTSTPSAAVAPVGAITSTGIGPAHLGMALGDLAAATGRTAPAPDECLSMTIGGLAGIDDLRVTQSYAVPGLVDGIYALSTGDADPAAGPRTAEGIGLGSTVTELQAAYPNMPWEVDPDGGSTQLTVDGVTFVVDSPTGTGTVVEVAVGAPEAPREDCG
ncbi:hypothetical protein Cch01nite_42100 [Cellulomonas chitinilytica]|uniref:Uncharacterized protein n=1 Tax=Cellulomonas chitinilytica TaxID=398759 RepID=A0A919P4S8_9CELL|nr:hypothetical protein [Cellulomonas chitinilytica]GIG23486.1 hypothetical protein Cch01nite_42100 [Cellulomonas chitinilytica]